MRVAVPVRVLVLMTVPVVQVGIMRMAMHEPLVAVPMRVRLAAGIARGVGVKVVGVVAVPVLVLHRLVGVAVNVLLDEVQPDADPHQAAREDELQRRRLAEQRDGEHGADEGCEREIGAGARGTEMAQRQDEEGEADAIADEARSCRWRRPCRRRAAPHPATAPAPD